MSETRTLRVVIAGDGKDARSEVKQTGTELTKLEAKTVDASNAWGKFTNRVKIIGNAFRTSGETAAQSIARMGTARLDAQLIETHRKVVELDRQFAITGDRDVFKKLRQDRGLLNQLRKVRTEIATSEGDLKRLARAGGDLGLALGTTTGQAASRGLASTFRSLPPQAQAGILASAAALGAAIAPLLGGIVAGAIVGGAGIGGVVGGVAIAATHPAVKSAATRLGETFRSTMQYAAAAFVPETVSSLDRIRGEVADLDGQFRRIFSQAARYVRPLTDGVIGFARNLLPGVEQIISKAGPVIDELASWGPKLGTLLSDVLGDFAENAHNGARALAMLWTIFEWGVRMVASQLNTLATVYGWMEKIGALVTGNIGKYGALATAEANSKVATDGLSTSLQDVINSFNGFGSAASAAAAPVETLNQAIDRITGETLNMRSSMRAAQEAVDTAAEAFKRNGATLDINTAKGRANEAALDSIASSYRTAAAATLQQTGSQQRANAVLAQGRSAFIAMADKMGLTSSQAKSLAAQLFAIPNVARTVTVNNKTAITNLQKVQAYLAGVKDKSITVGVYWKANGDLKVPGGTIPRNADGGLIKGPGTGTSDSMISRVSNGEYVLRAAAVKRLGVKFFDSLNRADNPAAFKRAFSMLQGDTAATPGRGLAARSVPEYAPAGGSNVQVVVNVGGSVTAERDLARSIATSVRDEISRIGKRNGGRTGL